jgi:NADH-quinone oxidoreductase subunit L
LLAIPSVVLGWVVPKDLFVHIHKHDHPQIVIIMAIAAFVVGILLSVVLFIGKNKRPYSIPFLSKLFANRFYIDEAYAKLIHYTHDALARIGRFLDKWIIDGALVRGACTLAWSVGSLFRFLQVGNVQAYSLIFSVGVVIVLFLVLIGS